MNKAIDQVRVAIQGFAGSFHHAAVNHYFGSAAQISTCPTFSELIRRTMEDPKVNYGLMAIENSIAGTILPNYQLLRGSDLNIIGEIYLKIGQQLLGLKDQKIEDITEIHSHHMAIKQCEHFLNKYPHIKIIETEDTALSAEKIATQQLKGIAAIASIQAAKLYDLAILAPNIETVSNNFTRFLVLKKGYEKSNNPNKASLLFSLVHQPGSLSNIINTVASQNINISKIQSFPIIEEEWAYYFALDVEFKQEHDFVILADLLKNFAKEFRILGVYQKGKTT